MAITRVRVPAKWQSAHFSEKKQLDFGVAEFTLGVGPCGKLVEKLSCQVTDEMVMICQDCVDGERKTFYYPMKTITGRIEITENSS